MPPFRYLPTLLLLSNLSACSSPDTSTAPAGAAAIKAITPDTAAVRQAAAYYQTVIDEPVFIDSSAYYYQPVEVGAKNGGRNLRDRISLSSSSTTI